MQPELHWPALTPPSFLMGLSYPSRRWAGIHPGHSNHLSRHPLSSALSVACLPLSWSS